MQWKQNDSVRWPSRRPHVLPGDGRPPGRVAPASPDRVAVMQKTAVQGAVSVRSAARFVRCAESSSVSGAPGGRARLGRGREEFLRPWSVAAHHPGAQSRGVETRLSCPGRRNCSRPFLRGRTTAASVPKSDMKQGGPTGHSPRRTRATGTALQCGCQQHGGEAEGTGLGAQGGGPWKDVKEPEELRQTVH